MKYFSLAFVILLSPRLGVAASVADDSSLFSRSSKPSCSRMALEFEATSRHTNPQGQEMRYTKKNVVVTASKVIETLQIGDGRTKTESVSFSGALSRELAEALVASAAKPADRDSINGVLSWDHPHTLTITLVPGGHEPSVELYAGDNFSMNPAALRARCLK